MAKKILVIESNLQTRKLFLECLAVKGFTAIGAENGAIGLQQVQKESPDLIVCEITLPGLDGFDVLTRLRQNPVTAVIPFIFVTSNTDRNDIRKAMELGADDYLTKPCTLKELMATIAAQMRKRNVIQQWYTAKSQQVSKAADAAKLEDTHSIFPAGSQMTEVFRFLEENYHRAISLCDVARAVGYSPAYLTNLVRQQTGKSVHRWLVERRMAQALLLLQKTEQTIGQISESVGYQDACHFSRYFRQLYGTSPQAWRSENRCQLVAR